LEIIRRFSFRDRIGDNIRKFYCDVLGGSLTKVDAERDFIRLGDDFHVVLYGDVTDESDFLRSARAVWLELKSDNAEETSREILESGLVRKLEVPDPHLYFQAPGGQCLRLVGIDEDLSFYEGGRRRPERSKHKGGPPERGDETVRHQSGSCMSSDRIGATG
jgi:hypothetical protein